jgi:hypothetical protein
VTDQQPASINAEVYNLAEVVFKQHGGRATSPEVQRRVWEMLSDEQLGRLAYKALGPIISSFFLRRNRNGLPQAPEVDGSGTHCQLELITVDEYRYLIRSYVKRSSQNLAMAYKFATQCQDVHGTWIDPGEFLGEVA